MALAAAALAFIAVSSLAGLLLAVWAGSLTVLAAWGGLLAGLLGGAAVFFASRKVRYEESKPGFFEWAVILFFLLFCLRNFLWVYYKNGAGLFTLNRYPYFDLHFHLELINNFVANSRFWPENPLFAGALLRYHFGMDFFSALLVKAGMPLTQSLPVTGVVCGVLSLLFLFWWGRGFTVAGFLFAGGLAGFAFFVTGTFEDYQADIAWKNIALTMLLPQRGYLFALPAGLLVLWSWRRRFLENKPGFPFWVEGLLWGVMPFFQINTFMVLTLVFVVWTLAARKIRESLAVYFTAIPIAVPFMLIITDFFQKSSMTWLKPGWMMDKENPFFFFLYNFGLFAPLTFWTLWKVLKSNDRNAKCLFLPAFFLFMVCMFVMFAPWEWDNTKMMLWCYLLFLPVMDSLVIQKLRWMIRAPLVFALFFSGFVCVTSSMGKENRGVLIIDRQEMDEVCEVVQKIHPEARVASAQKAYHPVLLCGRKLVSGGWGGGFMAYGLNTQDIEAKLDRLLKGEWDWQIMAKKIGARYLFWGPEEEKKFPDSNRPWEALSFKMASGKWGTFYDLERPGLFKGPEGEVKPYAKGLGWRAAFYSSADAQGQPDRVEEVFRPEFYWDSGERLHKPPFSIIFESEIEIPESEKVTFYLASDDGSRLSIGDEVLSNEGVHALRVREKEMRLKPGRYPVRIFYQDIGGGAALYLWWKVGDGPEQLIPDELLRVPKGDKK